MATTLTVTARGQVTLRKEILRHLGIQPGQQIQLELQPDHQIGMRAMTPGKRSIDEVFGCLKGKTNGVTLTVEEINQAIEEAGAAAGMAGLER